jgi:hypothetical protein
MAVRANVELSVSAAEKHLREMRSAAVSLTNDCDSVRVWVDDEDPRSMFAEFTGSREWERIILLADAAITAGKSDLGRRVLEIAIAVGGRWHEHFLAKKLQQLKDGQWNPDPRK